MLCGNDRYGVSLKLLPDFWSLAGQCTYVSKQLQLPASDTVFLQAAALFVSVMRQLQYASDHTNCMNKACILAEFILAHLTIACLGW